MSVIVAVDPDTYLDVIPGSHRWHDSSDKVREKIPKSCRWRRVYIPPGSGIVLRGDLVHRGVEYKEAENFRLFYTCPIQMNTLKETVFVTDADNLPFGKCSIAHLSVVTFHCSHCCF